MCPGGQMCLCFSCRRQLFSLDFGRKALLLKIDFPFFVFYLFCFKTLPFCSVLLPLSFFNRYFFLFLQTLILWFCACSTSNDRLFKSVGLLKINTFSTFNTFIFLTKGKLRFLIFYISSHFWLDYAFLFSIITCTVRSDSDWLPLSEWVSEWAS